MYLASSLTTIGLFIWRIRARDWDRATPLGVRVRPISRAEVLGKGPIFSGNLGFFGQKRFSPLWNISRTTMSLLIVSTIAMQVERTEHWVTQMLETCASRTVWQRTNSSEQYAKVTSGWVSVHQYIAFGCYSQRVTVVLYQFIYGPITSEIHLWYDSICTSRSVWFSQLTSAQRKSIHCFYLNSRTTFNTRVTCTNILHYP